MRSKVMITATKAEARALDNAIKPVVASRPASNGCGGVDWGSGDWLDRSAPLQALPLSHCSTTVATRFVTFAMR
jgi:hypothetical protein